MAQEKEYFAFISYKREDEKWAKWLQNRLESYKLPSIVREQRSDLPKYLRPIFRDGTDLTGGILADQLRKELLQSHFLIVICSPNATKSEWVNKEALTFIDEGRLEQIIPFIVDGIPHSNDPVKECFPKSLREIPAEKELLGINVNEIGKDMAFIRLVATMLGIRFDTLWQRHRRDLIRRRIAFGCLTVLLCLFGIFVWDYKRTTYEYYVDWVDCYGVPEGIIPLNDEQMSHRSGCYQFEYSRIPFGEPNAYSWRITKVSYVNSALRPIDITNTELKDRYPIQEIEYNKQTGGVSRINLCDIKGKVLLRHVLSERNGVTAAIADFVDSQEQRGTGFVGAELSSMNMGQMDAGQNRSNIVRFVYERDAKGHIIKQTYHANNDYQLQRSSVSDADGIFGRHFILDSLGRRVKIEYLGYEGEKTCTKKGVAGKSYEYDSYGNIRKASYVDLTDNLILNENLWAICKNFANQDGNIVERLYFDTNIYPCSNKDGIAKEHIEYNQHGFAISGCFYDINNKLCFDADGSYAKWTKNYDKYGNCIEAAVYDTLGISCMHKSGFSKWSKKYNTRGNCIEAINFDMDGKMCLDKDGIAKIIFDYDNFGNCTEMRYFGTNGEPCLSNEWYAKQTIKYDNSGNVIEQACYGIDGELCLCRDGYAKLTIKYDDRGNIIEFSNIGVDGKPCLNKFSVSKSMLKYDDIGNVIESAYWGSDGKPCLNNKGFAQWKAKYDDRGNQIEQTYFGVDGEPCLSNDGNSKWTAQYDERGNGTEILYFGINGEPCIVREGYAKVIFVYDERGNCIDRSFFGSNEEPVIDGIYGAARIVTKYDNRGNRIEETYFGTDGKTCVINEGYAKSTATYDARGNQIEGAAYGIDGKPCLAIFGCAKYTRHYNALGNIIDEEYFGVDGKPCLSYDNIAKYKAQYDDRGNSIEVTYYGIDGKPCLHKRGMAKETFKYDMRNNCIERAYWGVDNHLCLDFEGKAMMRTKFDDRNRVIEKKCYGIDGEKCLISAGFCICRNSYDEKGNIVEIQFLGTNEEPVEAYGFYRVIKTYNQNHVTSETYYNTRNEEIAQQIGTFMVNFVWGQGRIKGVPVNSVILQYNNWKLGNSVELLYQEYKKCKYAKKNIYYYGPDGEIGNLYVESGLDGLEFVSSSVDKSQADEWLKKLEAWKKEHAKKQVKK